MPSETTIQRPHFTRIRRTIAGVVESEAYTNFRFKKKQLLKDALSFPDELTVGNGMGVGGEECFLFLLRRMR